MQWPQHKEYKCSNAGPAERVQTALSESTEEAGVAGAAQRGDYQD